MKLLQLRWAANLVFKFKVQYDANQSVWEKHELQQQQIAKENSVYTILWRNHHFCRKSSTSQTALPGSLNFSSALSHALATAQQL